MGDERSSRHAVGIVHAKAVFSTSIKVPDADDGNSLSKRSTLEANAVPRRFLARG